MKSLTKLLYTYISILLILFSCSKDPIITSTFTDQGNIGKEGGIIKTDDGALVEIPAGALNTIKTISITNTTEGDTVINNGCRIYDLGPDGLTFSDSVIITLPFDDTYLDLTSQEENFGIGIMVFQDSTWMKLKTQINVIEKNVKVKTKHFSKYAVFFPSKWSDYFNKNKNNSSNILNVPFYWQGVSGWCAFYALSMITKYSGYDMKAPFFAALLDKKTSDGLKNRESWKLDRELKNINIETETAFPWWANMTDLFGYVLYTLKNGKPVNLGIDALNHAIVVTGFDQTGFYFNDSGGALLNVIESNSELNDYAMFHISYEKFMDILIGDPQDDNVSITMVIKSSNIDPQKAVTLNFLPGMSQVEINSNELDGIGTLLFDGEEYKPEGYRFYNAISMSHSFDGSYYVKIKSIFANSEINDNILVNYHIKIDNKDVEGSPLEDTLPPKNSFVLSEKIEFQLKNLKKGNHLLKVEIRPQDNPDNIFDYWEFPLIIENEFIDTPGTITDINGNVYNTVIIGTQTWMKENLKTTKYKNGSNIPNVTDPTNWSGLTTGAYCNYDNNISNVDIYGRLYNWYAVSTGNLCPPGWHVPSDQEWTTLITYLGGENYAGGKLKETGTTHWLFPNTGATNETGFTALPGGKRDNLGQFLNVGIQTYYASATEYAPILAWNYVLTYNNSIANRNGSSKVHGLSVRCLMD